MVGGDGRVIRGRYRVDRQIGVGYGTSTLLVTDLKTARPCVLRTLREAEAPAGEGPRFEAQAAVLARLDHPVIPRFVEYFVDGEGAEREHSLVVRYHPGESLERLVAKERPLTEAQAIALLRRLVPALVYLHGLTPPLVHRSIKASNIIVGPDGRPCLTDFDFALEGRGENTGAGPCEAEAAVCAPEVTLGSPVPASDIYSIGVATIFAMSGEEPAALPREGGRMRVRDAVRASEGFLTVLSRMVEPSLERRYPDADALDADLARLGAGNAPVRLPPLPLVPAAGASPLPATVPAAVPTIAPAPPSAPRRSGGGRRSAALPLFAALAAALVVAGSWWLGGSDRGGTPSESLVVSAPSTPSAPEPPPPPAAPEPASPASGEGGAGEAPASGLAAPPAEPASAPSATPEVPPPTAAEPEAPSAEGTLLFDGGPVVQLTAQRPVFWFRNRQTDAAEKPRVDYDNGAFRVYGLAAGRFGMSARFDLARDNPSLYPGDLDGYAAFVVEAGRPTTLEVSLRRIIHLTRPVDNGRAIPGWEAPCGAGSVHPTRVEFAWEPLGPGTTYEATVDRLSCARGNPSAGRVFRKSGAETQSSVELPPSAEGEFYAFRLSARRNGRPVGVLTTHGAQGVAWDYRFTVK